LLRAAARLIIRIATAVAIGRDAGEPEPPRPAVAAILTDAFCGPAGYLLPHWTRE
jgi:hypothetical protein